MIDKIKEVVACLRQGEVVIIPTETVYGLACDAGNIMAMRQICDIKKRSYDMPLQVLVSDIKHAYSLGCFSDNAQKLAEKFWPGGITLVVNKANCEGTIGIRIPDHPLTLEIIRSLGRPLASSSANITHCPPAAAVGDISPLIINSASCVIDGGLSAFGISSTVIDCTKDDIKILRTGSVGQGDVAQCLR